MILWDADGVLMQTFTPDGQFRWSQNIEKDLGLSETQASAPFHKGWDNVLRGHLDALDLFTAFFNENDSLVTGQQFMDYWLAKDNCINPDVLAQLQHFGGCIATNQDRRRAALLAQWFAPPIRQVFASSSIGAMKPDPDFFQAIEEALALPSERLCLIDDSLINVRAACERGWHGHHFTGIKRLESFLETLSPDVAYP